MKKIPAASLKMILDLVQKQCGRLERTLLQHPVDERNDLSMFRLQRDHSGTYLLVFCLSRAKDLLAPMSAPAEILGSSMWHIVILDVA